MIVRIVGELVSPVDASRTDGLDDSRGTEFQIGDLDQAVSVAGPQLSFRRDEHTVGSGAVGADRTDIPSHAADVRIVLRVDDVDRGVRPVGEIHPFGRLIRPEQIGAGERSAGNRNALDE